MLNNKFLIFYLVICNVDFILGIIYSCNQTANCGCSKYNANVNKIVGGEDASPASWGWAVSLQRSFGEHFCTGSIVSPLHIITAAHCVTDEEEMKTADIVVGIDRLSESNSTTRQVRSVSEVFAHPQYDSSTKTHDIAVIRLNESLVISNEMSTARLCLPQIKPLGKETDYPADSASLVAIGWGVLMFEAPSIPDDLNLQQVTVQAVPVHNETCKEFISDTRFQFCAGVSGGGKDTCQGDSGGPLMQFDSVQKRWLLAGVTSFGLGCGDPRYSGVYTRVSAYRDWFRSVINDTYIESLVHLESTTTVHLESTTTTHRESAATGNYYNICIVLLSLLYNVLIISVRNK